NDRTLPHLGVVCAVGKVFQAASIALTKLREASVQRFVDLQQRTDLVSVIERRKNCFEGWTNRMVLGVVPEELLQMVGASRQPDIGGDQVDPARNEVACFFPGLHQQSERSDLHGTLIYVDPEQIVLENRGADLRIGGKLAVLLVHVPEKVERFD